MTNEYAHCRERGLVPILYETGAAGVCVPRATDIKHPVLISSAGVGAGGSVPFTGYGSMDLLFPSVCFTAAGEASFNYDRRLGVVAQFEKAMIMPTLKNKTSVSDSNMAALGYDIFTNEVDRSRYVRAFTSPSSTRASTQDIQISRTSSGSPPERSAVMVSTTAVTGSSTTATATMSPTAALARAPQSRKAALFFLRAEEEWYLLARIMHGHQGLRLEPRRPRLEPRRPRLWPRRPRLWPRRQRLWPRCPRLWPRASSSSA